MSEDLFSQPEFENLPAGHRKLVSAWVDRALHEAAAVASRWPDQRKAPNDNLPNNLLLGAIEQHVVTHVGPIDLYVERGPTSMKQEEPPLSLFWTEPTWSHPYQTLVTCGMSQQTMVSRAERPGCSHIELCLTLPPEWPTGIGAFQDPDRGWPYRYLWRMADYPIRSGAWLWEGHTYLENCRELQSKTGFWAWLIRPPTHIGEPFQSLELSHDRTVQFFNIFPITFEEWRFAREAGSDALIQLLDEFALPPVVEFDRFVVIPPDDAE